MGRVLEHRELGVLGQPDRRPLSEPQDAQRPQAQRRRGDERTHSPLADIVGRYKRSKHLAEAAVCRIDREGSAPVFIANPSTPVGSGHIKPTHTGRAVVDFVNRRMPACVGTGLNLMDVREAAAGHLLAAERAVLGEQYILGNRNLSPQQILEMLAAITEMPAPPMRVTCTVALAYGALDTLVSGRLLRREPRAPLEGCASRSRACT